MTALNFEVKYQRDRKSVWLFVGPMAARIAWGGGSFGWREGDGPITRFVRRWWSGWHRWETDR